MQSAVSWQRHNLQKHTFDLSGSEPVRFGLVAHPLRRDILRDMHFELELGIVICGCMKRVYEDYCVTVKPGEAWLCGMWEPHGYAVTKTPCRVGVLIILPSHLAGLRQESSPPLDWLAPFAVPPRMRPRLNQAQRRDSLAIMNFLSKLHSTDEHYSWWLRVKLMELLLVLLKGWRPPESLSMPAQADTRIVQCLSRIFATTKPLRVAEAAAACGLNRNAFSRRFREYIGLSWAEFGMRYRLKGVAERLAFSSDTPKAIARDWGFADVSHLHRRFAEHYKCSPGRYRTMAQLQTRNSR